MLVLFKAGPQMLVTFLSHDSHSLFHRVGGHLTSGSRLLNFAEITEGRKGTYLAAHVVEALCKAGVKEDGVHAIYCGHENCHIASTGPDSAALQSCSIRHAVSGYLGSNRSATNGRSI